MTRTRVTLLLPGLIAGLVVGLTACGTTDSRSVASSAPQATVVPATDAVSASTGPATSSAATSTTSVTTAVAPASSVAANSAKSSTTAATATTSAAKPDLSAVLALIDSAEKSAAAVDKELNTSNNAMNSTEQDPQP